MIAVATCRLLPETNDEDRLLLAALNRLGLEAEMVNWDDSVVWNRYRAVVIRSTWDYYLRCDAFLTWCDQLEASGIPLLNPARLVRWNSSKIYLRELETQGIPGIPTLWLETFSSISRLQEAVRERGWDELILKPAVSGGAYKTFRTSVGRLPEYEADLRSLLPKVPVMVQPFLSSILSAGEWSLIFFAGEFSHAVLKRPAAGDFRVQTEFGGSCESAHPPKLFLQAAQKILRLIPEPFCACRIDLLPHGDGWLLGEVELIEPFLYLTYDVESADRLAKVVNSRVAFNGFGLI